MTNKNDGNEHCKLYSSFPPNVLVYSHITFKQNKIIQIITCYFKKKSQHTNNVGIGLHYQASFVEDKKYHRCST
jgi:hypothetical protein